MDLFDQISNFGNLDAIAVAIWLLGWLGIGLAIERASETRPSVSRLMIRYRHQWMHELITRQPRIFDATILSTLRQGTTFFASASMIAIGGGLALVGNTERLQGIAQDLTLDTAPAAVWEVKLLAILLLVTNAFLKFVWSHRLFGYCAVVMAAVPNQIDDPRAEKLASQAAALNVSAARSFNRGMRSLYFALGGLGWLLGAIPLVASSGAVFLVLWRREFHSESRAALLDHTPM